LNASSKESATTAPEPAGVLETLARLDRLRGAIREALARAAELERDFAARARKLQAQYEEALAAERARWTAENEAAQAEAAAARQRIEARHAARQKRIARALENARKQKLAEIEAAEGKNTFELQRAQLEADRVRDADTQTNKTDYENFNARLAEEQAALQRVAARARSTLRAYPSLARPLDAGAKPAAPEAAATEHQLLEQLRDRMDQADRGLRQCRARVLPVWFRFLPVWLWVGLILAAPFAFLPELRQFNFQAVPARVWGIVAASLAGVFILYLLGRRLAARPAAAVAAALHEARQLHDAAARKADARFAQETERIQLTHVSTTQMLNNQWQRLQAETKSLRADWSVRLGEQARKLNALNDGRRTHGLARLEQAHAERVTALAAESARRRKQIETTRAEGSEKIKAAADAAWQALETDWREKVLPLYAQLQEAAALAGEMFPPWRAELWRDFKLPEQFAHAARFAELAVDLEKFCEVSLTHKRLALPGATLALPLLLAIPRQASVLFETKQSGRAQVVGALNNLVLRLLTSAPPGRLAFTIFDPVGLGQNFAGIMHLADFEERLIHSRIWTQPAQFEQRLGELNEHIEKVTQMYLRNEYETLAEYNAQAGRLAEKYQFLVIADFPVNFSDVAVKRLQSIAASGPRCGVHLLLHWDQRKPAPVEFVPEELRQHAICIVPKGEGFVLAKANWDGTKLTLDAPPEAELATRLLQQIGQASTDSYRVEMPFEEAAPADGEMWSLDTTHELRVPIGRTGATKLQYLALGQGTRQHGLVAGKTGSGKSTLFHVIITNLALWCSPDQVEFYLVDFKKGVEFKCYATHKLPHARVIAIESDREFGLSVLQRVDEELKRRGDLFRKLGAQDLAGYKRAGGHEPMPRVLLLIDEFQEFFVEDDRIAQSAALLLDRIVRQGRAFGIHVLLGSQTLGGAYTLARATIGQMVVRIALQCNETDAHLIMTEDNPAPRLLSRPGEAIYNDDGGALAGNSPFQVVWLPDQQRDEWLAKVRAFAERGRPGGGAQREPRPAAATGSPDERAAGGTPALRRFVREPIVFEGNAPANVRDNPVLRDLLDAPTVPPASGFRVFLGAPNSIKGPTEAVFRRASGSHLLVVGQREEAALALVGVALVSLAAQHPKSAARFRVFDCSAPDSAEAKFLERAVRVMPHEVKIVRPGEADQVLSALAGDQRQRAEGDAAGGPETYVLIHGLQRNKKLRFDEEMSFSLDASAAAHPGLLLNQLICEGGSLGFHVIATCDTYNNVMRMLSRKALSEFEMRVVFQMSANDSASLIDSPAANHLGLHRAILFNGHEGWLETFRPYALPDEAWWDEVGRKLAQLHR
jgi:S-DNA-T family DNA segregation ATPase FtsK/SpoIIIE